MFGTTQSMRPAVLLVIAAVAGAMVAAAPASAGPCSDTATSVYKACKNESGDDYYIAIGNCINVPDRDERIACREDARADRDDARDECADQRDARLDLCDELGEDRYDPDFDPDDFTADFTGLNPYFPLAPGNTWTYEGDGETITVEVLDETKLIEGVTCIVVNDLVDEDGDPIEDTDDWYGQAANGDVWYCGEISQNFELFDGDDPEVPELVDVEGSWKAGRDDAKPGIVMFAAPEEGTFYRQEVSLGDAEDAAEVISTTYGYGNDPELDQLVPEELADLLCDDDCLVTREFTPVEPDVEEFKYYAPGVGLFLEINLEEEGVVQLVGCNVDAACAMLPDP